MSERCSRVLGEVRSTVAGLVAEHAGRAGVARLLDVGCWDGQATEWYANAAGGAVACGVEVFPVPAAAARQRGIDVAPVDLEHDRFPWTDGSMDLVVANQVLEHLKNLWLPLGEIWRVLAPGGAFVVSVPNLASLHNRVLLAAGRQPSSIRTTGPHVRGFTYGALREVLTLDGAFTVDRRVGVGFYPGRGRLADVAARFWPGGAHTIVVVATKVGRRAPWLDLAAASSQTYFGSPGDAMTEE